MSQLSASDVDLLLGESSAEIRASTAAKIAIVFEQGHLDDPARKIAEDIFRHLARDVEVRVRKALSVNLKESRMLPHDVAMTLAKDVIEVAEPILKSSQVLTEADLVEIVRTQPAESLVAVAQRETVTEAVSEALVDNGNEDVVVTLVANQGAEVSEDTFEKVLDKYSANDSVKESVALRDKLPVKLAERLVNMVSAHLQEHLVSHHELAPEVVAGVIAQSRERVTLELLSPESEAVDVDRLVDQLHTNRRLTPTIILRAVCTGDIAFFEAAMARLANISPINVHVLIHDSGDLGLHELYRKAGLPDAMYPAMRVAVNVTRELTYDGEAGDRRRFRSRMIERFLTQFEGLDVANFEYLMARIGQNSDIPPDNLAR
ncbi:MAG: DUF2336 domain-containing protein [Proteobacteria bacterium]|nr:DUF2336 domain-containing protein [Pseudomonadota bacterium]